MCDAAATGCPRVAPSQEQRSLAALDRNWPCRCPAASPSAAGAQHLTVWGVDISADGKLIVATYADGTIRWHRLNDGAELLALFMHPDGKRWVAWTPQGYYDASAGADDLIGWQVNRGYDQAPDFFPAAQFQQRFNRRDVIARVLDTLDVDQAVAQVKSRAPRQRRSRRRH